MNKPEDQGQRHVLPQEHSGAASNLPGIDPTIVPSSDAKSRAIDAVWVASADSNCGTSVALLEDAGFRVREASTLAELLTSGMQPEVVFIEHTGDDDRWVRAWRAIRAVSHEVLGVLVVPGVNTSLLKVAFAERMIDVMAAGDCVELSIIAARLRKRVREQRDQSRRLSRLRRRCGKLEASRRELLRQIGGLCDGVMTTYQSVAKGMKLNTLAAEFETIIRQDLDIEGLLRTTLEYSLRKIGSTNGAIFLPNSCGDFTLGAYVNFDLPRDTAETLIGQLADTLAPGCEQCRQVVIASHACQLGIQSIDPDHWVGDQAITVQACWQDNECIAVVAFFRDPKTPFAEDLRATIAMIGDTFGRQLARVVRTHHRHKPKEQWGGGGGLMAA
jgi:hypothetical protein